MRPWRVLAAMISLAFVTPYAAVAATWQGNAFLVPVHLTGLPPEVSRVIANCYMTDAAGRNVAGGETSTPVEGGRLSTTLSLPIRRVVGDATGIATGYWCRLILIGDTVQFWSNARLTDRGWPSTFSTALFYIPAAPRSVAELTVRGTLTPAEANLIAPPGTAACPCGCGATTGSAASACTPGQNPALAGNAGVNANRRSSSTPLPDLSRPVAPVAPTSATIRTPRFAFAGTGVLARP